MSLIYDDEVLINYTDILCDELNSLQDMVDYYHKFLRVVKQYSIMQGETSEAIASFDSSLYGALKNQYSYISKYLKTQVPEFNRQVDDTDEDLY